MWVCGHPHKQPTKDHIFKKIVFFPQKWSSNNSSSSRSWGLWASPDPCWNTDWLMQALCSQCQLLRVHSCSSPVMSRRHHFLPVLPSLWILQVFLPTSTLVLSLGGCGCHTGIPFVTEHSTDTFPVCALTNYEFLHELPSTAHRNFSDEFIPYRRMKHSTKTARTAWAEPGLSSEWLAHRVGRSALAMTRAKSRDQVGWESDIPLSYLEISKARLRGENHCITYRKLTLPRV